MTAISRRRHPLGSQRSGERQGDSFLQRSGREECRRQGKKVSTLLLRSAAAGIDLPYQKGRHGQRPRQKGCCVEIKELQRCSTPHQHRNWKQSSRNAYSEHPLEQSGRFQSDCSLCLQEKSAHEQQEDEREEQNRQRKDVGA